MRLTRAGVEPLALASLLAVGAVVFELHVLFYGALLIAAMVLATQWGFLQSVVTADRGLEVEQQTDRPATSTDVPVVVTLRVHLEQQVPVSITIRSRVPPATRIEDGSTATVTLGVVEEAISTMQCSWSMPGIRRCHPPAVSIEDPAGWFETEYESGDTLEMTVEADPGEDLHIGQGGDGIATAYGEHRMGTRGSGTTPADIRKYVPGDAIAHIDWKATARLNELFVRDFEAESDIETAIVLDHRAVMGTGDNVSKLEYLLDVGLTYLDRARALQDPVGLVAVGDEGITSFELPDSHPDQYDRLRSVLQQVEPTESAARPPRQSDRSQRRRVGDTLDGHDRFSESLRPFFSRRQHYIARVADEPLFRAVRQLVTNLSGNRVTILLTDDTHRAEVRESAKVAARHDGQVYVFLAASPLFDSVGVMDLERSQHAYLAFESFRRDLDAIEGVRAFEIGPMRRVQQVVRQATQRGTSV